MPIDGPVKMRLLIDFNVDRTDDFLRDLRVQAVFVKKHHLIIINWDLSCYVIFIFVFNNSNFKKIESQNKKQKIKKSKIKKSCTKILLIVII